MSQETTFSHKIKKAFTFVGPQAAKWMSLGILGSLILAVVELAIAYSIPIFFRAVGLIDSNVMMGPGMSDTQAPAWAISIGLIALGIFRFVGQYLVNQSGIASQEEISARLRKILIYRMLLHPKQEFLSASQSNYYLSTIFIPASAAVYLMTLSAAQVLQAICLVFVMMTLTWKETIVGIGGLLLIGLSMQSINNAIRHRANLVPKENKKLIEGFERVARNWLLVRILRTQRLEHEKFSRSIVSVYEHSITSSSYGNLAVAGTPLFGILLLTTIVFLSQTYWMTAGSVLISFLYIFIRFVQGLSAMVGSATSTAKSMAPLKEAYEFFFHLSHEEISQSLAGEDNPLEGTHVPEVLADIPPSIIVKDLKFSYGSNLILNNVTFTIPAGRTIGIVGPSGSGKSTLLLLILGALRPSSGSIQVGSIAASELLSANSTQIGYVGPEPFLFEGTIRENLVYGMESVSEEQILDALRGASLLGVINSLSNKLEHRITENGEGLSAGQKQRLCLARVFLRKPALVILDEATANLDLATEKDVIDSLQRLKTRATIIIVSHRMTTLQHADFIFDVEKNNIIGPHEKDGPIVQDSSLVNEKREKSQAFKSLNLN